MSNVVQFSGETTIKQDADKILEANKGTFDEIAFMGISKEGKFECGANFSDLERMLTLVELFKRQIIVRLEDHFVGEEIG